MKKIIQVFKAIRKKNCKEGFTMHKESDVDHLNRMNSRRKLVSVQDVESENKTLGFCKNLRKGLIEIRW